MIVNASPGWPSAQHTDAYMTFDSNYTNYTLYQLEEKEDVQCYVEDLWREIYILELRTFNIGVCVLLVNADG